MKESLISSTTMCVIAPLLHRCTLTGHYRVQAFVRDPDVRKLRCQQSDRGRARAGGLAEPRRRASWRRRAPTLTGPMRTAEERILRVGDGEKWHFFFPRHHRVSHKYLVTSHFLGGVFQSRCADKTVLTAAFIRLPGCPLLHPISAPQISHCPCE